MRLTLKKLLENLGVDRVLMPYETQPWVHYDAAKAMTCSAEVRIGPGAEDLEAEIQFLKDEGSDASNAGALGQIMHMRAIPHNDGMWEAQHLRVKGKDYTNEIHEWDLKGCNFFRAVIGALLMGVVPDIDELIEKELSDDDGWGGGRGKVGRKAPKIKPAQLMGLGKKGF